MPCFQGFSVSKCAYFIIQTRQIKSCHYTLLYRNYGSIRFYMCSTVQSPQAVLNGVINLLSIKDSRDILISVNYTINLYIFVTDLVDNNIIFPYHIFIICPKADPFGEIRPHSSKHLKVFKFTVNFLYGLCCIFFVIFDNVLPHY